MDEPIYDLAGAAKYHLASSILVHGLIHNLTVVEQLADNGENSGKYEVVAGGRRFAALQRLSAVASIGKQPPTCDRDYHRRTGGVSSSDRSCAHRSRLPALIADPVS